MSWEYSGARVRHEPRWFWRLAFDVPERHNQPRMDAPVRTEVEGGAVWLHWHPTQPGDPPHTIASLDLVAGKGIGHNP